MTFTSSSSDNDDFSMLKCTSTTGFRLIEELLSTQKIIILKVINNKIASNLKVQ